MPHPHVVYELTPTLGLAVTAPEINAVETKNDQMAFRVTAKAYPVKRDEPGADWKPIPAAKD